MLSMSVFSQINPNSIYSKDHIKNRKPIPFSYVRECDVMWSKLVWRVVDLREKLNQPLYYPSTPQDDRYSLISLLLYGIEHEGLTAYDTANDEFNLPISLSQIKSNFGADSTLVPIYDDNGDKIGDKKVAGEMNPSEVKQFVVKEQWFFDKQTSTMQVRIIGLCPIREYVKEGTDELRKKQLFWVYFPEARNIFATHEVFNPMNDAARISYDDVFMKRMFNSYVTKVSNVHDNRAINSYAVGINSMLESNKVQDDILRFEHDLWEY